MTSQVKTTCPYCGVGCGVIASVNESDKVIIKADPEHPANYGRLCSKGAALADTLDLQGRLLYPEIQGAMTQWDTALDFVANKFTDIIQQHGPDAVGFYVSGQLLTEDYYVANKFMKGFIGSANIDTNSRLCMSSAVAAYKRAFGTDTVPCSYEDLERAKLIVLVGSNTAWCHPVVYQRIVKTKKDNPDLMVVVVDPRRTNTCDIADIHLAIKPGQDHILFNGLFNYLNEHHECNRMFVDNFTEGLDNALAAARNTAPSIEVVAEVTGLPPEQVEKFYKLFTRTERVVTLFSQGINQWSYGTDNGNAIINCHLISGRIGRPGMGPFSITGQPNAMGGREVGGLANQLAVHMDINNPQHRQQVQTFWQSPRMAAGEGLKAVDMFRAMEAGRIKAVWIMATNPAVSLPRADWMRQALNQCELVVVSDCMRNTDTTARADVLLPALTWGERDGTVTNSERCISRQRPFLPPPGEARPDWWIMSQVASRMGYSDAFDYAGAASIFKEHAALSAYENNAQRDFDIGYFADINQESYDQLQPVQWPVTQANPQGTQRMFSDGRFYTENRKARFIPVNAHQAASIVDTEYPLILNTGRVRDHWHTMTRTGKAARLSGHIVEPYAELNPLDAIRFQIENDTCVSVQSRQGKMLVKARITDTQQPGSVFVPIHWNDQFSSHACVDALVGDNTDPVSGQPEFKYTAVSLHPFAANWYGFVLSRKRLDMSHADYWACARGNALWRYEVAGSEHPESWLAFAHALLNPANDKVEWVEFFDQGQKRYRAAKLVDGRLESCIFIGPDQLLPERDWLSKLFETDQLQDDDRRSLLTGRPSSGQHDVGRVVCSCFSVGINTIVDAIREQQLTTAEAVGEVLKVGTNCGSCVPEIRKLIQETLVHEKQGQE